MDYVEDCLYEISELSKESKKRKKDNGCWMFIYNIPGVKRYAQYEWILNETNLNILKSLKPAVARIKSRIPAVTVTIYFDNGKIIITIYNSIETLYDEDGTETFVDREDIEVDDEEDDEDWEEDDEDWEENDVS